MSSEKKYILIDSRYRTSGSTSNFKIFLPDQITIKSYIKINSLYMPRLSYLINQYNNTFKIIFGTNTILVTLPFSNYSPSDLSNYINSQVSINNFIVSYNSNTYKYTFSANTNFSLDFSVSDFYKLLSMNKQIYNSANNYFVSGIINFNFPKYININLSNIPNDVMIGNTPNNSFNFIVPIINSNYGDIIEYNNVNFDIQMKLSNFKTNYFDLVITDDYNYIFENNNAEFFFVLEYDSDN